MRPATPIPSSVKLSPPSSSRLRLSRLFSRLFATIGADSRSAMVARTPPRAPPPRGGVARPERHHGAPARRLAQPPASPLVDARDACPGEVAVLLELDQ